MSPAVSILEPPTHAIMFALNAVTSEPVCLDRGWHCWGQKSQAPYDGMTSGSGLAGLPGRVGVWCKEGREDVGGKPGPGI